MWAYTLRRLLALIPTLIFASLIVFATLRMIPGNVIDMMLSQNDISAGRRFSPCDRTRPATISCAPCRS